MKFPFMMLLPFILLVICGCACDDDDDDGAHDEPDDDTTDNDDDADGDDDDDDSFDDDSVADDDVFEPDRFLSVPAVFDGSGVKSALLLTQWTDGNLIRAKLALIASPNGDILRESAEITLGLAGAGWAIVEDFTGDGLAEIAVSWVVMDAGGNSDSRIVLYDPANLAEARTIADFPGAQTFFALPADINGDGVPELAATERPDDGTGETLHVWSGSDEFTEIWNLSSDAGDDIRLDGLPARSAWIGAGDYGSSRGFLAARSRCTGDDPRLAVDVVAESGETANSLGPFPLAENGSYSLATADADRDGRAETAISVQGPDLTALYLIGGDFGAPERTWTYPLGTRIDLSFAYDLDGDEYPDLAAVVQPPAESPYLDLYFSTDVFTDAVTISTLGDRLELISTPRIDGMYGPGALGSTGTVFGVLQENYSANMEASIDLYADARGAPFASIEGLAGEGIHLRASASMRDFDGDGDVELATISTYYDIPELDVVYHHRIAVFDDAQTTAYDPGWIDVTAHRGGAWDFDGDGVCEFQAIHYGSTTGDSGWVRLRNGNAAWESPVLSAETDDGADIYLIGLIR